MNMHSGKLADGLMRCWAPLLVTAVALFATSTALLHAGQPLLEAHAFRQTQTALTSLWMVKEGWRLDYQTPVAGFPWSIPFEFPLFQFLAALVSKWGGWDLDPVGRLLSFSFLIACAWPAFRIARCLDLPRETVLVFCALLWSSPLYLFWGRTFMIETAALFLILAAVPYALALNRADPGWKPALLFLLFASLAMLQKVTTAAPVILVLGLVALRHQVGVFALGQPFVRKGLLLLAAFIVPVVVAALWTHYSDAIKERNLLGAMLTSKALVDWNFGSIAQRLDPVMMKTLLWDRILARNGAGLLGVVLVAGALFTADPRTRKLIAICLALFLLPLLIFTNLHLVHAYYPLSSVVFFLAALALALGWRGDWNPAWNRPLLSGIAVLALVPLVDFNVARYLVIDPIFEHNPYWGVGFMLLLVGGALFGAGRVRRLFRIALVVLPLLVLIGPSSLRLASNGHHLLLALQLAIIGLALMLARFPLHADSAGRRAILAWVLVLTNLYIFVRDDSARLWLPGEVTPPIALRIAEAIRANTPEDSGVVVFGLDWSSEVAYYAQRKAFAVPDWFAGYGDVWADPAKHLGGLKLGALVFCPSEMQRDMEQILAQPDVSRQPDLQRIGNCHLWLAKRSPSVNAT
jgi:hypothetical protein